MNIGGDDNDGFKQTTIDQFKNKFRIINNINQSNKTSISKSIYNEQDEESKHPQQFINNNNNVSIHNSKHHQSFSSDNGDSNPNRKNRQANSSKLAQKNKNFLLLNWPDYFPEEKQEIFNPQDYRHLLIETIFEAYDHPKFQQVIEWGQEKKGQTLEVFIDYQKMKNLNNNDKNINDNQEESGQLLDQDNDMSPLALIQDVMKIFSQNAETILPAICLAIEHIRTHKFAPQSTKRKRIICRIYNLDYVTPFQDLKANLINHFITLKGIVLKTSSIRLLVIAMKFLCFDCKRVMLVHFTNGMYIPPSKCINPQCKGKTFCPDKTSASTILFQRIRIQELEDGESVSGRVPRFIDCELKENLVGTIISGDNVMACGMLKTETSEANKVVVGGANIGGGNKKTQGIYTHYMDINSIINLKSINGSHPQNSKVLSGNNDQYLDDDENISENDYKLIQRISEQQDVFPLLVKSLCPTIYGHELLKAGLVLAILGGAGLNEDDDNGNNGGVGGNDSIGKNNPFNNDRKSTFRRDCHVLLIGDPGLGKSQMLKFVANVSPRSVYVCGNATSNAGLTVSVSKDQQTGESTLEAGALILSDQGVCCIDEFDKMQDQHYALLEAMEQQTVSLAKSGVLCSLQSRATIIASANPVGGHYNKAKNIKENIKISNAILSRFDLIFLMLDKPDPNRDQKLSEHIMKLHNNKKKKRKYDDFEQGFLQNYDQIELFTANLEAPLKQQQDIAYTSFTEKITRECEKIDKNRILQPFLIRKYLTYAKNHIYPTLSTEAAEVIKSFYLTLRENNSTTSSIPITTRQLESLIRLAQARAKVELRQEVSKVDAQDVVDLMYESLFDSLEDMSYGSKNQISLSKGIKQDINNVSGLSKQKQTKLFLDKLKEEGKIRQSYIFDYQDLAKIAKGMNMNVGEFSNYIEELNFKNILMHKGGKSYELLEKGLL